MGLISNLHTSSLKLTHIYLPLVHLGQTTTQISKLQDTFDLEMKFKTYAYFGVICLRNKENLTTKETF